MDHLRRSGILLHPTSLPGPYGIGEIGPDARAFADLLAEMGQKLWQVLPIGPISFGNSPYQSPSTFAGNHLLISFDDLASDGLLVSPDLSDFPRCPSGSVDYGTVIDARERVLGRVCNAFDHRASHAARDEFESFCERESAWLDDYALFMAIKRAYGGRPWPAWPDNLRSREPGALAAATRAYARNMRHQKILQFLFDRQWRALMDYCHARDIQLVGDVPIFVAHDSSDVWAHRELYYLEADGSLTYQSGVPPDYFSKTGQLWGNPLYNWSHHKHSDFAWWIARVRKALEMVDCIRIDHFRGMVACWRVAGADRTAEHGRWARVPGRHLFEALHRELGDLPFIAEDLGVITRAVERLRDRFGLPGMRILQFAFGSDPNAEGFLPENYPSRCVVYTGTHDNDTTVGWFQSQGNDSTRSDEDVEAERKAILEYFGTDGGEIHWDMIGCALRSNADTAIVPLQDLLGLGTEARLNMPGRAEGNWEWRFSREMLTPEIRDRMRTLTEASNRA